MSGFSFDAPGKVAQGDFALGADDLQLTAKEIETVRKILRPEVWMMYAADALLPYLSERLVQTGINIPVSQIPGFTQFGANFANVLTSQSRTSSTFGDLVTVGPSLTALENGVYLVLNGCQAISGTAGVEAKMAYSVNGAAASTTVYATNNSTQWISIVNVATATLSSGNNNSLVAKYASSDNVSSASFYNRWLVAIKQSNV